MIDLSEGIKTLAIGSKAYSKFQKIWMIDLSEGIKTHKQAFMLAELDNNLNDWPEWRD